MDVGPFCLDELGAEEVAVVLEALQLLLAQSGAVLARDDLGRRDDLRAPANTDVHTRRSKERTLSFCSIQKQNARAVLA